MIWGAMSSAGFGPLCFLKTNVTAPIYQDILEHLMLPSADQLFKDADFIFQQDLAGQDRTGHKHSNITMPLCIRQGSKRNYDSVSVEERDWSAERQVLIPAEHFWSDFITLSQRFITKHK